MADTNESLIELVKFEGTGLEELEDQTVALVTSLENAEKRAAKLSATLRDPTAQRYAAQLEQAEQSLARLGRTQQSVARSSYLLSSAYRSDLASDRADRLDSMSARRSAFDRDYRSGAYAAHAVAANRETRASTLLQRQADIDVQRRDMSDGGYARDAVALANLNREQQILAQRAKAAELALTAQSRTVGRHAYEVTKLTREQEHYQRVISIQESVGRHGVAGAALRAGGGYALGAGAAAFATGSALAYSGFHGTVEEARFSDARQRVGRQAAGIAKPLMDRATNLLEHGAAWLERQDEDTQNAILGGGLLTTGAGVAYRFRGRISGAYNMGRAAYGAYAARSAQTAWVAGMGLTPTAAVVAGGAGAGIGVGTRLAMGAGQFAIGPVGIGAALMSLAPSARRSATDESPWLVQKSPDELKKMAIYQRTQETWLGRRYHNMISEPIAGTAADAGAFMLRQFGVNKTRTDLRAYSTQLDEAASAAGKSGHRDVTPVSSGYQDIGAQYEKAQMEMLKVIGADSLPTQVTPQDGDTQAKLIAVLEKLDQKLDEQNGNKTKGETLGEVPYANS